MNTTPDETTGNQPVTFTVDAQPATGEHPMAALTRAIAERLSNRLDAPANAMHIRQYRLDAPPELHGVAHQQITIGGHTVNITATPDPRLRAVPTFRVAVDGIDAPCRYTLTRPLADLIADAAHQTIIRLRRSAPTRR